MENLQFIQWLGSKTCNSATDFLTAHQTCTNVEAFNWGAIIIAGLALAVAVQLINARRQSRRENYYW